MVERTTILDGEDTEPQREETVGDATGEHTPGSQAGKRGVRDLEKDEDDTDGNV
jgi:hypothetical protein